MLRFGLRPEGLVIGDRRIHYAFVIVAVATVMWMTSSSLRFAVAVLVPEFEGLSLAGASPFITARVHHPVADVCGPQSHLRLAQRPLRCAAGDVGRWAAVHVRHDA